MARVNGELLAACKAVLRWQEMAVSLLNEPGGEKKVQEKMTPVGWLKIILQIRRAVDRAERRKP